MSGLSKKVEIAANVAIMALAMVIACAAAKRFWLPRADPSAHLKGSSISIPGVNWRKNGESLVLALSPACHFCAESAQFYRDLVKEAATSSDTRLVGLFPERISNGKGYLQSLGIDLPDVRRGSFPALGIEATPTLLLVDQDGIVRRVWIGKLAPVKQAEVLSEIRRRSQP